MRDFSNWERKGPLSPVPGTGPPVRDGGRVREGGAPPPDRSPAWEEGRSDAGSRPPRREFEARPAPVERAPTAAEQDGQWRLRMQPDASPAATPDVSSPSSPQPQAPKERPKLNLTKRTVSTAENDQAASSASDAKSSPFGARAPCRYCSQGAGGLRKARNCLGSRSERPRTRPRRTRSPKRRLPAPHVQTVPIVAKHKRMTKSPLQHQRVAKREGPPDRRMAQSPRQRRTESHPPRASRASASYAATKMARRLPKKVMS